MNITLFLFFLVLIVLSVKVQEEQYSCTAENLKVTERIFKTFKSNLEKLGRRAKKKNNPDVETLSNKLEGWVKSKANLIEKHKSTEPKNLCDKPSEEKIYLSDFLILAYPIWKSTSQAFTWEEKLQQII